MMMMLSFDVDAPLLMPLDASMIPPDVTRHHAGALLPRTLRALRHMLPSHAAVASCLSTRACDAAAMLRRRLLLRAVMARRREILRHETDEYSAARRNITRVRAQRQYGAPQ